MSFHHTMPSLNSRRAVAVTILALLAEGRAAADVPVAPSPEPLGVAAGVEPAALEIAATPAAPVPLGSRPAAASPAAPPRPLPDWRLLAALGGAFAVLAGYRLFTSRRVAPLPGDVFEVLGEAPLGGQQAVRIVRFGPRTLLVGVSAAGCQTLAELTDPQATEAIVAACRSGRGIPGLDRRAGRREARG